MVSSFYLIISNDAEGVSCHIFNSTSDILSKDFVCNYLEDVYKGNILFSNDERITIAQVLNLDGDKGDTLEIPIRDIIANEDEYKKCIYFINKVYYGSMTFSEVDNSNIDTRELITYGLDFRFVSKLCLLYNALCDEYANVDLSVVSRDEHKFYNKVICCVNTLFAWINNGNKAIGELTIEDIPMSVDIINVVLKNRGSILSNLYKRYLNDTTKSILFLLFTE